MDNTDKNIEQAKNDKREFEVYVKIWNIQIEELYQNHLKKCLDMK